MKYLGMVLRNARRNPIRSILTVGSLTISLALAMVLVSSLTIRGEVSRSTQGFNRIIVMSSQGLGLPVPIARLAEVEAMPGVAAATPFSWYGGKYNEEVMPFAQFGVDPGKFFTIYDDLSLPADQLRAWREDKSGCVIGRKLAQDRKIKLGDPLPLRDGVYPYDLLLTVRGIYDGQANRDLRACYFHWEALDEGLKKAGGAGSGNAGVIVVRCQDQERMAALSRQIDKNYESSNAPTRTQSEEAFGQMFAEMAGDFQWIIVAIGLAVGISLLCVSANAMAMALRERTTEVAVLKAIGFGKPLVVALILAESLLIAGVGGLFGAIGVKLFFDVVDLSKYTAGFLPFFYVPWTTALGGLVVALGIGAFSGLVPAIRASRLSVVNGLRKVV
jgi:putative ABC transport system permease protein